MEKRSQVLIRLDSDLKTRFMLALAARGETQQGVIEALICEWTEHALEDAGISIVYE